MLATDAVASRFARRRQRQARARARRRASRAGLGGCSGSCHAPRFALRRARDRGLRGARVRRRHSAAAGESRRWRPGRCPAAVWVGPGGLQALSWSAQGSASPAGRGAGVSDPARGARSAPDHGRWRRRTERCVRAAGCSVPLADRAHRPPPAAGTGGDGATAGEPAPTSRRRRPGLTADRRRQRRGSTRIDTALLLPCRVDIATWTLRIHGLVDRETTLTWDELVALPMFEQYVTIACVSNEVGGDLVGNAKWTGVRLRDVLDLAGVQPQRPPARRPVGRWLDRRHADGLGHGRGPRADDRGQDERRAAAAMHGYPARLIVPGLYGYVSATKWLTELELTTLEAFDGYWVPLGWAKEAPILTQSRIDTPRGRWRPVGCRSPASPGRRTAASQGRGRDRRAWHEATLPRRRSPTRPGSSGSSPGTRRPAVTRCGPGDRRRRRPPGGAPPSGARRRARLAHRSLSV